MEKICNKCKMLKSNFYKNKNSKDGFQNSCKDCFREYYKPKRPNDYVVKVVIKKTRQEILESNRSKYNSGYYSYKSKTKDLDKKYSAKFRLKFPEKIKAINVANKTKTAKGIEKHHWSYNEEHYSDFIEMERKEHRKLHRYILYDDKSKMYTIKSNGQILNSKECHLNFYNSLHELP
jgi:hypothetical protein